MHASHSESSKKIYHRLYKLSADKISAKQFIRYSSGKPLYRISRNQFIGRNKTGATTHGAGFTNIGHYKIFCVNGNTGFRNESRIFYFIHLQNEEAYERKESSSA